MKKTVFFITLGICGFSLLVFLVSRFSRVWLGVEIIVLLALFLMLSMTKTERLDSATSAITAGMDDSSSSSSTSSRSDWWAWGGWLVIALLIGALFFWAPWSGKNFSPAISKADREIIAQGWVELVTPGPDEKGFWSVVTPTEAIGKNSVVFKTEVIAERANGDVKKFVRPKKILVFSAGLNPGGLPDLKFAHPPSQGRIWAKFQ